MELLESTDTETGSPGGKKYILTVGLAQITEVDGSRLSQLSYDGGDSTVSSNNLFQVGLQLTIIFVVE